MAHKHAPQRGSNEDSQHLVVNDVDPAKVGVGPPSRFVQWFAIGRLITVVAALAAVTASLSSPSTLPWATASAALGPDIFLMMPGGNQFASGFAQPCSNEVTECVQAHGGEEAFNDFMQNISACKTACFDEAIAPCTTAQGSQCEAAGPGGYLPQSEQESCSRASHGNYGDGCQTCIQAPPKRGGPNRLDECLACGEGCHNHVPGMNAQWRELEQCITTGMTCVTQAIRFETTAMISPSDGFCFAVDVSANAM